jgi:hypothetical protein
MIKLKPTNTNILIILILAVAIIFGAPIALIWSLNTLFPALAIPYTLETWLAAFLIPLAFRANVTVNKDK